MNYQYEVGDTVVVTNIPPIGGIEDHCSFVEEMHVFCGRETVITDRWMPSAGRNRHCPRYSVKCDNGEWTWIENWLLPADIKVEFDEDITRLL